MKIAICDDEVNFTEELKSKIYEYSNKHNWETAVDTYFSGIDLVNADIRYNIIILDYSMDNIDGLETARRLRNGKNRFSCIIFLTSYPDIAISAYEVDTYRFVVKSSLYDGLFRALDDFRTAHNFDYDICLKTDFEYVTVNTGNITFIEVQNKNSFVHLSSGELIDTRASLSSLYKEVPHTHFFKVHKSFIVNFQYIRRRSGNDLYIQDYKPPIPIGKNCLTKFKNAYYNYLKDTK